MKKDNIQLLGELLKEAGLIPYIKFDAKNLKVNNEQKQKTPLKTRRVSKRTSKTSKKGKKHTN